ncbi:MAG: cation:proton antiporter [Methanomicrobia archaeon]|nr:cation:proton antiporter [Methanomicrobia archaeon]
MPEQIVIITHFAFLLGLGVLVANLFKKLRVPDTFFLLLVGLLLGPTIWTNPKVLEYVSITPVDVASMGVVPDFLRILALIMVIFTGSFHLNFTVFKRFSGVATNLAITGVIFSTLLFGVAATLIFGLDIVPALLLGSVLSGTSSAVVFALKDTLQKREEVLTILKVESVFNSPLCLLIPVLFLDLIQRAPGAAIEPFKYLTQFWQLIAAGVGTGLILGLIISKLLYKMLKDYSPLLSFALALVTYAAAENVGGSGMLAVGICGLVIGNRVFPFKEEMARFEDALSEMLRIAVFTLLGAQVLLILEPRILLLEFIFFLLILVSRQAFVMPLLGELRPTLDARSKVLVNYVAPRGIPAAAMAPLVATVIGNELIINIVFVVILLSVLFSTAIAVTASKEENPLLAKFKQTFPIQAILRIFKVIKSGLLENYILAKPTISMVIEWPLLIVVGIIGTLYSLQTIPYSPVSTIVGGILIVTGFLIHRSSHAVHKQAHQQLEQIETIVTTGIYERIRHPGYLGLILMYFGFALAWGIVWILVPVVIFVMRIIVTALKEEQAMREKFGDEYEAYMRQVQWRFIPRVF